MRAPIFAPLLLVACSTGGAPSYEECKKAQATFDIASESTANAVCEGVRARGGPCQVCVQSLDSSGKATAWFAYEAPFGCTCSDATR